MELKMNYTDDQLKQLLAKMLPETVKQARGALRWNHDDEPRALDTELLHLCDLAERIILGSQMRDYENTIASLFSDGFMLVRYSWQQRVIALAEVKGVTL